MEDFRWLFVHTVYTISHDYWCTHYGGFHVDICLHIIEDFMSIFVYTLWRISCRYLFTQYGGFNETICLHIMEDFMSLFILHVLYDLKAGVPGVARDMRVCK